MGPFERVIVPVTENSFSKGPSDYVLYLPEDGSREGFRNEVLSWMAHDGQSTMKYHFSRSHTIAITLIS
jgi:hypothetical protein